MSILADGLLYVHFARWTNKIPEQRIVGYMQQKMNMDRIQKLNKLTRFGIPSHLVDTGHARMNEVTPWIAARQQKGRKRNDPSDL